MKRVGSAGFTLVEILVVLVIIAILAGITLASYTTAQNRGYDAAVSSDLAEDAKILTTYYSDNGQFPTEPQLAAITPKLKFLKQNYNTTGNAVLYCRTADGSKMAIIAESKSGAAWYVSDTAHVAKSYTASFPAAMVTACSAAGVTDPADGSAGNWLHTSATGWDTWVAG